jgi:hypothetical protein
MLYDGNEESFSDDKVIDYCIGKFVEDEFVQLYE